jgi:4a-hydroxytetrahydrobiopterin dehydratase
MSELLDHPSVDAALSERGIGWERDQNELVKIVGHRDFAAALAYVNSVGALAEAAGHHTDIDIRWATVTLRLSTHSAGGLTSADLNLAARIDGLSGSTR